MDNSGDGFGVIIFIAAMMIFIWQCTNKEPAKIMEKLEQLEKKIDALKASLDQASGSPCAVYTRISGYYRPLHNWNKGKRSEYKARVEYKEPV